MKTLEFISGQKVWAVDTTEGCFGCMYNSSLYCNKLHDSLCVHRSDNRDVIFQPYEEEHLNSIIYLDENDLNDMNCVDSGKVAQKYGFKYLDDFFDAINKTVFVRKDSRIHEIEVKQFHDVYPDYFVGKEVEGHDTQEPHKEKTFTLSQINEVIESLIAHPVKNETIAHWNLALRTLKSKLEQL